MKEDVGISKPKNGMVLGDNIYHSIYIHTYYK